MLFGVGVLHIHHYLPIFSNRRYCKDSFSYIFLLRDQKNIPILQKKIARSSLYYGQQNAKNMISQKKCPVEGLWIKI